MLKRMISVMLMALTLVALLCACGGDVEEEKTFVLEDVYQSIMDAQSEDSEALVMFPEADPAVVDSIYPGLSEIELTQQALYFPPILIWCALSKRCTEDPAGSAGCGGMRQRYADAALECDPAGATPFLACLHRTDHPQSVAGPVFLQYGGTAQHRTDPGF